MGPLHKFGQAKTGADIALETTPLARPGYLTGVVVKRSAVGAIAISVTYEDKEWGSFQIAGATGVTAGSWANAPNFPLPIGTTAKITTTGIAGGEAVSAELIVEEMRM